MSEQSPDLENRFIPNPLDYDVLGDFDVDAAEARLDAHLQAQSSQTIIDADEIRALSAAYHASLGIVEMIPGELSDLRAHAAIAAATAGDLAVRSIFQQKDAEDQKIHTAHLEAKLAYSAREKDAAEELSTIDPLTKLPNRHALVQYLDQIKGLAQRAMHDRQLPANVLFGIIDLDDFKQKNTEYTHAGGDEVIKQVALMIRSSLRETDILLRIGGDELAVLLPDTDVEGVYLP